MKAGVRTEYGPPDVVRIEEVPKLVPGLTFEEAAAIPQAGAIALQGLRVKGQVRAGQKVLINGAGGAAGSFAVQLAKVDGAEVTGVDHGDKGDFLRGVGAGHVIDYTNEDFTKTGEQYDLILDTIATAPSSPARGDYDRMAPTLSLAARPRCCFGALLLGPLIRRTTGRNVRVLVVPQDRNVFVSE